jgi:hypothetical protein
MRFVEPHSATMQTHGAADLSLSSWRVAPINRVFVWPPLLSQVKGVQP